MLAILRYIWLAWLLVAAAAQAAGNGEAPPPVSPAPALPVTEATLSVLEPAGEQCEWVQLDALSAARRVIARLAADCQGGGTALSADGRRGAARFWRGGVSVPAVGRPTFPEHLPSHEFRDRLFTVELATGRVEELPLPPLGELVEYGFDAQGRLLGLTLQAVTPAQERARAAEVEGTVLPLAPGTAGRPLLAHAFAYDAGKWSRRESKASTDVNGARVLEHRKALGERSGLALDPRFEPGEIEDDALLDQLYPFTPEQPDGEWTVLRSGGHTLAIWGTPFGEEMLATGLLRRVEKGQVVALPKYPFQANDLVSLRIRGPLVLVSLADSGGHARLYRGRKLVWSSETARAVTFWPR